MEELRTRQNENLNPLDAVWPIYCCYMFLEIPYSEKKFYTYLKESTIPCWLSYLNETLPLQTNIFFTKKGQHQTSLTTWVLGKVTSSSTAPGHQTSVSLNG